MASSGRSWGELARRLDEVPQERGRLDVGVRAATELVPGCDHASVTMVERHSTATLAVTGPRVLRGDQLQYASGEGPCLEAARTPEPVLSQDLAAETRWPRWSPHAVQEVGLRSVLSLQLRTSQRSFGSLNLYADRPGAYTAACVSAAELVAAHLAVAVAAGREADQLRLAMAGRTVVGQAQGLLMERLGPTPDEAFSHLRRLSQHQNRKLAEVAGELVETRVLPPDRGR